MLWPLIDSVAGRLHVVPMLDDQTAAKAEDVEEDGRPTEVALAMGEHVVAVFEGSDDLGPIPAWRLVPQEPKEPIDAIRRERVVLDVLIRIDVGDRRLVSGADGGDEHHGLVPVGHVAVLRRSVARMRFPHPTNQCQVGTFW